MEFNRTQTNKIIKQKELEKKFNEHINPVDWDNALPVDENFKYYHQGFFKKIRNFLLTKLEINPFIKKINKSFNTKIYGVEHLKELNGAISTSNHVNKFDCLVIKHALESNKMKKVYVTSAEFNNQKGTFGELMRIGGLMPFSKNLSAMRNFNTAIGEMLNDKHIVHFYPEEAMWLYYRKPRPFKNGAFHYAVKHNKPILPLFITFTDSDKLDEEGLPIQNYHLHIMPPIYPKKELTLKENIEYLKSENQKVIKNKYNEFYKENLL